MASLEDIGIPMPSLEEQQARPVYAVRRSVVVHSGARDGYQLARALSDAGLLDALVTDLYWPADRSWTKLLSNLLPTSLLRLLKQRSEPSLPSSRVKTCAGVGLAVLLLDKLPHISHRVRRTAARRADNTLGRYAGRQAMRHGSNLVSYSYYAHAAFTHFSGNGILFQLHPHPLSMRRILNEELAAHPDCAESLRQEWELSLPEPDFQRLVQETMMPSHILAASSFTRRTLIENGCSDSKITVVPYGVDCIRFRPPTQNADRRDGKLNLLFVGRINQRKGVKYLLEALRLLNTDRIHLTVCGRVVDGLELFKPFGSRVEVRPSVSDEELLAAYQSADLFVFPSVAEGFGQVLLESLACGLPILSTTHTAAPDLIDDGVHGFIVEPRRPDQLAERMEWALDHRSTLSDMGVFARQRAELFTWQRFRSGLVSAILKHQAHQVQTEYSHV